MSISEKYYLKLSNERKGNESERKHLIELDNKPIKVTVDSNNQCNLDCPFCGYSIKNNLSSLQTLPFQTLKVINRELFQTCQIISPSTKGEPILYYNFYKLLNFVYDSFSKLEMYTNGLLLNEKVSMKILPILRDLKLSIESTNNSNYANFRVGSDLDLVMQNIRTLKNLVHEFSYLNPATITYQVNIMKSNIKDLIPLIYSAEKNNIDRIALSHIYAFDKSFENESLLNHKDLSDSIILKAIDLTEKFNIQLFSPRLFNNNQSEHSSIFNNNTCSYLYKETWIMPNGDVKPCFFPDSPVMGNILNESFNNIWNGQHYKKMRQTVNTDNPFYFRCKKCPIRSQFEKNSKIEYQMEGFIIK